ncbi:MAG: CHAT domain-containing protein [Bryobacteraceae bacterium]|nr:CHAT domain-containing protein [Bryobacteraceae bacterium]
MSLRTLRGRLLLLAALLIWAANGEVPSAESGAALEMRAARLFSASRYAEAEALFRSARESVSGHTGHQIYLRLTSNIAGCRYAQFDYQGAVALYQEARDNALAVGEFETAGVALINLSSVYSSLWEPDASDASIREAARHLNPRNRFYAVLKAQESAMEARRLDRDAALRAAREAVDAADARGDHSLVAQVWNRIGLMALAMNSTVEAEAYLTEALRLRLLLRLPMLESSYRSLARLRLRQGRTQAASHLLRSAEAARLVAPSRSAPWAWEADRAAVLAAAGKFAEARRSYQRSIEQARAFRAAVLPVQSAIIASEVSAAQIAGDYALLLAQDTPSGKPSRAALESLQVLETARAEAFQADLIQSAWRQRILGGDYARALSMLRAAEAKLLVSNDSDALAGARKWRAEVAKEEARMGAFGWRSPSPDGTAKLPQAPPAGETWLSFKTGEHGSLLWIMTSRGVRIVRIPSAGLIARDSGQLSSAIRDDGAWLEPAAALYDALFSELTPDELANPHWRLSLDGPLCEIPFAALAAPSPSGRRPLILNHTLTVTPSLLLAPSTSAPLRGRFVGVGDAIYNLADSRLPQRPGRTFPWFALGAATRAGSEWDLPRLPGSARELKSVASVLNSAGLDCRLLTGSDASIGAVVRELAQPPAVLHFAAHILAAPQTTSAVALSRSSRPGENRILRPGEVFIGLSRSGGGENQLLSSTTVSSTLRADNSLVVLSGCGGANGANLPGVGLQGMARAWLAARARSVVGSLWAQPDSAEPFFRAFYQSLARNQDFRTALQAAQTAMFRQSDWRNRPRHWAGWRLVG